MAKDRTYEIEILTTGPKPQPVLKGQSGPLVFDKKNDKLKKVDHYRVRFELDKPNKTDLRFIQDMDNVMWVHSDVTKCPDTPCHMPDVIWVDEVDDDGEWIDVINMDLVAQEFRFTLNFADKKLSNPTPADYVPLDPVGDNRNRGSAGSIRKVSGLVTVGIGVAAGLVAFAAAEAFLPDGVW